MEASQQGHTGYGLVGRAHSGASQLCSVSCLTVFHWPFSLRHDSFQTQPALLKSLSAWVRGSAVPYTDPSALLRDLTEFQQQRTCTSVLFRRPPGRGCVALFSCVLRCACFVFPRRHSDR